VSNVGATRLNLALLDGERVVEERQRPTRSDDGPDAVFERIVEVGRGARRVDPIGVVLLPVLSDVDGTALLLPNLHGEQP